MRSDGISKVIDAWVKAASLLSLLRGNESDKDKLEKAKDEVEQIHALLDQGLPDLDESIDEDAIRLSNGD